jgi:hypothetical protein
VKAGDRATVNMLKCAYISGILTECLGDVEGYPVEDNNVSNQLRRYWVKPGHDILLTPYKKLHKISSELTLF